MFALIWCCLKLRSYSRLGHNFKVNLWWLLPCYLDPRPPQWGWQMGLYHLFSNSRYSDASGAGQTALFLRLMLMRLQLSSGSVALLSYIRLHHQINHVWFLLLPHQVESCEQRYTSRKQTDDSCPSNICSWGKLPAHAVGNSSLLSSAKVFVPSFKTFGSHQAPVLHLFHLIIWHMRHMV